MSDLKILAETYSLKENLYCGGWLQKDLRLIGDYCKRTFLRTISKEKLNEEGRWNRLEGFLRDKRTEREIFVISEKMEYSLNLNFQTKFDKEKEKNQKGKGDSDSKSRDSSRGYTSPH